MQKFKPISVSATRKQSHVVFLGPFSGSTSAVLRWVADYLISATLTSRNSEKLSTNVVDRLPASQNPKLSPLHSLSDSSGLRMLSGYSHELIAHGSPLGCSEYTRLSSPMTRLSRPLAVRQISPFVALKRWNSPGECFAIITRLRIFLLKSLSDFNEIPS
jgi:hypothetical protein